MKKYVYIAAVSALLLLVGAVNKYRKELNHYKELYNTELLNVKAYEATNSKLGNQVREFSYTIDALRCSNDSIHQKLIEASEKLKIKDKNIKYLQYQSSVIHKTDTVHLRDTIFREMKVPIDTVIGDKWYNMNLRLEYPSTIVVSPTFRSEKYVIVNTKKEYVNKPSKIFFIRWFQKKRTIVTVDIVEENPYIENKDNRFINIVK